MADRAPQLMQAGGAAVSGGSGVFAWVEQGATLFTALGALIGCVVAILGYRLARQRRAEEKIRHEEELKRIRAQTAYFESQTAGEKC
jgi:uncharacterized membrane protein YdjX (TVP38/TMEM64 family)